jgi:hypothetical protein
MLVEIVAPLVPTSFALELVSKRLAGEPVPSLNHAR